MAAVHVVSLEMVRVARDGSVYHITNTTKSIKETLTFSTDWRITPDTDIPNSANYPTLKDYLNLEAAAGFAPVQVTQNTVITYHA